MNDSEEKAWELVKGIAIIIIGLLLFTMIVHEVTHKPSTTIISNNIFGDGDNDAR